MAFSLQFEVLHRGRRLHAQDFEAPIELGRQEKPDEPLFQVQTLGQSARIAIARLNESSVSRHQVLLEPLLPDRVRVVNVSAANDIRLRDGTLRPGAARELFAPCQFSVQEYEVRIAAAGVEIGPPDLHSLAAPTVTPGGGHGSRKPLSNLHLASDADSESLIEWLQAVTQVLQSAADTDEFFAHAAAAVVDLVGLDSGRVLLREGSEWKSVAQ